MPPRETAHRLSSIQLGNERTIWIRPPHAPATASQLTVVLDAEFYRDRIDVSAVLDELESSSPRANSWWVFVSSHSPEARWCECPCHPPFTRFVCNELLPWLHELHPPMASCTSRTLVGLSYTGLAAAYVALTSDAVFDTVVAQSGSFWWNDCWLVDHVRAGRDPLELAIYLDVGTRETGTNVRHREDVLQVVSQIDAIRLMRDALRARGCNVRYVEFDGGHDFAAWKTTLPDALRWALSPPGQRNQAAQDETSAIANFRSPGASRK